jgi:hypothetical protein
MTESDPQHARLNGAGKPFQFAVGVFLDELAQLEAQFIEQNDHHKERGINCQTAIGVETFYLVHRGVQVSNDRGRNYIRRTVN